MNNREFKKGEISREAFDVLMHDLESLDLRADKNNEYHYDLLKGNLKDIFGIKRTKRKTAQKKDKKYLLIEDGLFFPEDFAKLPKKTAIVIKTGFLMDLREKKKAKE